MLNEEKFMKRISLYFWCCLWLFFLLNDTDTTVQCAFPTYIRFTYLYILSLSLSLSLYIYIYIFFFFIDKHMKTVVYIFYFDRKKCCLLAKNEILALPIRSYFEKSSASAKKRNIQSHHTMYPKIILRTRYRPFVLKEHILSIRFCFWI